jgi:hypothetical protein
MLNPFAATAATNNLGVGARIPGLIRTSYSNVTTGNHSVFSADEILARDTDIFFAHVARDRFFIHRLRVAVDQHHFVPWRSQRFKKKTPSTAPSGTSQTFLGLLPLDKTVQISQFLPASGEIAKAIKFEIEDQLIHRNLNSLNGKFFHSRMTLRPLPSSCNSSIPVFERTARFWTSGE